MSVVRRWKPIATTCAIIFREFVRETESAWGTHLLENFEDFIGRFWLVKPKAADFNKLLSRLRDTD